LFGMPLTSCGSTNMFGCCSPGFANNSRDNTSPTTDWVLPFGGGDACVVDVVCEPVVVAEALVGAVSLVADASAVGALFVTIDAGALLTTGVVTDVVAVFAGDSGLIGLAGLVGLFIDFLQVSDVVTQGSHVGLPYGFGHVEERVWVMLPV
jgi:hypothetical protein